MCEQICLYILLYLHFVYNPGTEITHLAWLYSHSSVKSSPEVPTKRHLKLFILLWLNTTSEISEL